MQGLNLKEGAFIIDGTLGAGGHAREIIRRIGKGTLLAIDRDPAAVEQFSKSIDTGVNSEIILVVANYASMVDILRKQNLRGADGLLLDLGFSSDQLESGRGFSFNRDEPLSMTYDPSQKPVATILKELNRRQLAEIIRTYSDERFAQRIANTIKDHLKRTPIETSKELADIIASAVPASYERGRIHPATRTFQALRIYANDEIESLKALLSDIEWLVRPGGRVVVVSFHSIEDRIVKTMFREKAKEGLLKLITKKPMTASAEEIRRNPRARSAKLRIAEIT